MELAKNNDREEKAYEELQVSSKPFIMALNGDTICKMVPEKAGDSIYDLLKIAEYDSGLTKLHDDDLIVLAKSLYDLILSSYPTLTIQELKTACKSGVLGNYGEWFGICLKSVVFWIKGYLNSEGRAKAIKEWNAKLDIKIAHSPTLLWEFKKEGAIKAFEEYKKHGRLPFGAFAYYDIINEGIGQDYNGIKTLVTDKEERKRICEKVLQEHQKIALQEREIAEKKGNFLQAEKIVEDYLNAFKGNMDRERKTLFLKSFFDTLIKNNKPLNL